MRAWRFDTNVLSVVTPFFLVSTGIVCQFLFLAEMNTVCAEICTKSGQTAGVDATAAADLTLSRQSTRQTLGSVDLPCSHRLSPGG